MKVILLEDVKDLGQRGDICEVKSGYARNFLVPQRKALEATTANLRELKKRKEVDEKIALEAKAAAQKLAESLLGKQVAIEMKAGEGGKLFGSVSTKEIALAYLEQFELDIDRKKIQLSEPIRSFGVHQVSVRLHPEVSAELSVLIKDS